ncbi:MAG: undecaprenyl-diphosphatase UppP [Candidatus Yanofskybacteria bacterium RIFCSPHIGHO2_02_FULL_41_11]|uniref:Undecaprenyl-diphosphatase n=1 Tax=Candidatus Yanofskybacteria bacterium RIFCSPHIGHO2_02_FULL_41_11 TaxID=1802675 RepID=A0A1F8F8E2_9BACT|nr:MAG: undecaprenyl-diphosphatase UppP [Candidatus Yanofskybacteria bacterium RIFCSPHIGHO2_02_FULL_41_11]
MSFLEIVILGIVEGFTEFLPISSTGHLILTSNLLRIEQNDFLKSFEIAIQLGAILSVVVLYFKKFLLNFEVIKRVVVAFIPAAVIGFLFYGFIKNIFLESETTVLWSLLLGGIVLIIFEFWYSKTALKINTQNSLLLSYRHCFFIGLFQALAVIPGVSRAGATILGGLWLGVPRKTIVEFSFLLALPTMAGATGLDLVKNASGFSYGQFGTLVVGFVVSFITAVLAIKFLLSFIQEHTFISFGIYRIILAIVFLIFLV